MLRACVSSSPGALRSSVRCRGSQQTSACNSSCALLQNAVFLVFPSCSSRSISGRRHSRLRRWSQSKITLCESVMSCIDSHNYRVVWGTGTSATQGFLPMELARRVTKCPRKLTPLTSLRRLCGAVPGKYLRATPELPLRLQFAKSIWQRRGASLLSSSSSSASVWSLGPSLGEFTLPGLRALGASAACLIWFKKRERRRRRGREEG